MACHFTYRLEGSGIIFGTNNTAMTNTDGSVFDDSDYLSNDWATVFKKIKVDTAIKGLSNVAVVFETYFFDEQRPSDVPIEEYTIGDGGGHTLIGYNFSSKNFTITHFDSKVNPITKNPLTDYRFDSGAVTTSLMDTTATVSIDLNTIDDYWARRAKALKLKYYYL